MKKKLFNSLNVIIMTIISVIMILPFMVMILSCFSSNSSIKGGTIFKDLSFTNLILNYNNLINTQNFVISVKNSLIVSILAMLVGVLLSSLAGYAFTMYKTKHSEKTFMFMFMSMMIPSSTIVVPLFMIFKYVGLLDTYFSLIITSLSLPFSIYLFKQNTKFMPIELIRAARIDGLSEFEIYYKVYIPCMKPVFITSALLIFIDSWSSLLIPVILIQSQSKFTNSIFLNSLGNIWYSDYGVLMMALVISIIPVILLFVIFQKQFKNCLSGIN